MLKDHSTENVQQEMYSRELRDNLLNKPPPGGFCPAHFWKTLRSLSKFTFYAKYTCTSVDIYQWKAATLRRSFKIITFTEQKSEKRRPYTD